MFHSIQGYFFVAFLYILIFIVLGHIINKLDEILTRLNYNKPLGHVLIKDPVHDHFAKVGADGSIAVKLPSVPAKFLASISFDTITISGFTGVNFGFLKIGSRNIVIENLRFAVEDSKPFTADVIMYCGPQLQVINGKKFLARDECGDAVPEDIVGCNQWSNVGNFARVIDRGKPHFTSIANLNNQNLELAKGLVLKAFHGYLFYVKVKERSIKFKFSVVGYYEKT